MEKYVNKDGSFNHGKWLRETQLEKARLEERDEDTNTPGWQLARALNSLASDIDKAKHEKTLKWAETYHRTVPDTLKMIETLKKFIKKMK